MEELQQQDDQLCQVLQAELEKSYQQTVQTIFGDVSYTDEMVLKFPVGILGFPQVTQFVLCQVPNEKLKGFFLLQPMPEIDHTFIVMPLPKNDIVTEEDIKFAKARYQFSEQETHFFGVVTFRKHEGQVRATVNLAAPILLDLSSKNGVQHVFEGRGYPLQHQIMAGTLPRREPGI